MKYSIESLLNGIEAHNRVQLGIKSRTIKDAQEKYDREVEEYWGSLELSSIQHHVNDVATYFNIQKRIPAEQMNDLLRNLENKISKANQFYAVRIAKRKLDELQQELANLHAGTKTEFELWLLSLQDEGVTEITSNSIKTAGFDEKQVTKYVTAARKLDEEAVLDQTTSTPV